MRGRYLTAIVTLGVIAVLAVALYPVTVSTRCPAWPHSSGMYLKQVGGALRDYARDHDGALPESLGSLYPNYTDDVRVKDELVRFRAVRMVTTYYRPQRLGDRDTPVAEIRLYPSAKTQYRWRGSVLWGDLQVRLEK